MLRYRDLLIELTLREIKARYKQSFLGFFWVILNPFFQMLILSFVFSKILRFSGIGVPYPVFLYAGLLPWTFLVNSLNASLDSLSSNTSLIKQIYFPREILVLSAILAKAFDFFLSFIIFLFLMVFFKVSFSFFMLVFIPVFILQAVFVFGVGLVLAAFNLFYRDVQYLFSLVLTLWFYLTPVIYAVEFFPEEYRFIFKLNPMAVFINAYRKVLLGGDFPKLSSMIIAFVFSFLLFFLCYKVFKRLEGYFADIV